MKRGLLDLNKLNQIKSNAPHPRIVPHMHQKQQQVPTKPHRNEIWGILPDKRRVPHGWPACLTRQPPRLAFRNNNIYIVDDEEYEEPRERHPKVQYKLRICNNPAAQNMPHEKEFDDNNCESIDQTAI